MGYKTKCKIIGIGSALGSKRKTNNDIAAAVNMSPEYMESKTGVKCRYWCDPYKENLYVLMASAAEQALHSVGFDVKIDGIFSAHDPVGEYLLPNTSSIVATLMGLSGFYNGGTNTGCSGGLVALNAAYNKLLQDTNDNGIKNYLILAGNVPSNITKKGGWDEVLFSDAASAIIVSNNPSIKGYYFVEKVDSICFPENSNVLSLRRRDGVLYHDGAAVYKFATGLKKPILKLLGIDKFPDDTYFIPHQANLRIINKLFEEVNPNLVYKDEIIEKGNTAVASTFIGLEDVNRRNLSFFDKIILTTFGEGLTIGVAELLSIKGKLPERLSEVWLKEKYMKAYQRKWELS